MSSSSNDRKKPYRKKPSRWRNSTATSSVSTDDRLVWCASVVWNFAGLTFSSSGKIGRSNFCSVSDGYSIRNSSIPEPNPSSERKRCRNVVPVRGLPTSTIGRFARVFANFGKNTWSSAMKIATTVRMKPKKTATNKGMTFTPKVRRSTR
jgi:hypothetical protein